MNPMPLVLAMLRRDVGTSAAFVALIALAVGLAAAITSQERALRSGSARAADKFDLIVAAPGSQTDVLLRVVFLQPGSVELLQGEPLRRLMSEARAEFVAPVGFGDSYRGNPVVGTTAALVDHLASGRLEGRSFIAIDEAVVGAASPLGIGESFQVTHGHGEEAFLGDQHGQTVSVVGRLPATGSPWDRAVIVPIEFVWDVHGLGTGHGAVPPQGEEGAGAPEAHEEHPSAIGPPFDLATLPGIPAAVLKPATLADAYGLRGEWRTSETMAFFPAEVLVELYELLGNMRAVMSGLAIATELLLVGAILCGILILMRLYRHRFAILRALGASRLYVFAVAWCFAFVLIAGGSVIGLGVAAGITGIVSALFAQASGIALDSGIGWTEAGLAAAVAAIGALLAIVPAALLYREPVVSALRGAA
ncbi:MAG TPA: FtsX-like permease family protein [Bauldia sp.]|nr:FtsX-like permease family protein [Bauldia sp.]